MVRIGRFFLGGLESGIDTWSVVLQPRDSRLCVCQNGDRWVSKSMVLVLAVESKHERAPLPR